MFCVSLLSSNLTLPMKNPDSPTWNVGRGMRNHGYLLVCHSDFSSSICFSDTPSLTSQYKPATQSFTVTSFLLYSLESTYYFSILCFVCLLFDCLPISLPENVSFMRAGALSVLSIMSPVTRTVLSQRETLNICEWGTEPAILSPALEGTLMTSSTGSHW